MSNTEAIWGNPRSAKDPVIFLHGLPGIKSKQNQDLAFHIHRETNKNILLPFGEGLGIKPGTFLFSKELQAKTDLVKSLDKAEDITIVGHSWGGYQALYLAAQAAQSARAEQTTQASKPAKPPKIKRLILMSPLMGLLPRPQFNTVLDTLHKDHPEVNFAERKKLLDDRDQVDAEHPIEKLIKAIPATISVHFIQAKDDPVTPPQRAQSFLPLFNKKASYEELACDHNFLVNRPLLFQAMLKAILAK